MMYNKNISKPEIMQINRFNCSDKAGSLFILNDAVAAIFNKHNQTDKEVRLNLYRK